MITLNGTFFIELLIYGSFYYFVKVVVWPKFCGVLEEREAFIEQGLQSARDGYALLQDAEKKATECIVTAEARAKKIFEEARTQADHLKEQAVLEIEELRALAQKEAREEYEQMKERFLLEAREHYLSIANQLCEKVLRQEEPVVAKALNKLIHEL